MKKKLLMVIALPVFMLICINSAMAFGIGGYMNGGYGITGGEVNIGGGVMYDTNVAKKEVFNYRGKFGYSKKFSRGSEQHKVSFISTFGIAPKTTIGKQAKFWFGPQVGIHYLEYELTTGSGSFMFFPMETTTKVQLFQFDMGLVLLGFNFNFGKYLTLTFEFGPKFGYMVGSGGRGNAVFEVFANMGILFRINDTYSGNPDNRIE